MGENMAYHVTFGYLLKKGDRNLILSDLNLNTI